MIDPHARLAELHAQELRRSAAEFRRARPERVLRPSPFARLYVRIWWASRPRATSWAPTLLDPSC